MSFIREFHSMQAQVHMNAKAHGWWDGDDHNDGEKIALIHREVSEILEALRDDNPPSSKIHQASLAEEELADVVLRCMDWAEYKGFDLAAAIIAKHEFNRGRPYKHGGKKF